MGRERKLGTSCAPKVKLSFVIWGKQGAAAWGEGFGCSEKKNEQKKQHKQMLGVQNVPMLFDDLGVVE